MSQVNIHEAKTTLSKLIERASRGEEIVIAKNGQPVAKLVAIEHAWKPRTPGSLKHKIRVSRKFDAPLPPDIADALGADSE